MTTKYRNKPCVVNGEKYRSQKEMKRHRDLLLLERAGHISSLSREVPYQLAESVKFEGDARAKPALRYVADFTYIDHRAKPHSIAVVEDCKGMRTPVFNVKRHLMKALLGIEVKLS